MNVYLELLQKILDEGETRSDRTGVGTISLFGDLQYRVDLREGFPLLTTKKLHWKSIVEELLWILSGSTNNNDLKNKGVTIWNEWAASNGDLGKIYGHQWRNFGYRQVYNCSEEGPVYQYGVDQISNLIRDIKSTPNSRRLIVTTWNPIDIENKEVSLPACHTIWQVFISTSGWMDLKMYQRSADMVLGVPFNCASYSLLLSMIAQVTGYRPRYFYHTFGDAHIYLNHLEQVKEQLLREPQLLPKLTLNPKIANIFDFKLEDCIISEYNPWPPIKAPVAI